MVIAPTEPPAFRAIGKVSSLPEQFGADAMFSIPTGGLCGIQRKEFGDLYASMHDGRLAKEIQQMAALRVAVLVVEGKPTWTLDGELLDRYRKWDRDSYDALLFGVQAAGVWVRHTDRLEDTIRMVGVLQGWLGKKAHRSLLTRPKPKSMWGQADNLDYLTHIMQSFPGWGPAAAKNCIVHFGGRIPLMWDCTLEELMAVPGVGPKRAKAAFEALRRMSDGDGGSVAGDGPGREVGEVAG